MDRRNKSLVIKKLQKSLGPLVFLFLTLFSPSLMANDCFLQAANKGALSGGLRACIRNLTASNPTLASAHGDIRRLVQLHQENPNDPEFRSLSLAASQVYYSDEIGHCGAQSRTKILCERLRQLSLLHPEGFFENQHPCQTPNCRSYVIAITRWLKASPQKGGTNCDGGFLNRHFCSSVARAFMDTPPCQGPSTPQACVTHMEKNFTHSPTEEKCLFDNYRGSWNGRPLSLRSCAAFSSTPSSPPQSGAVEDDSFTADQGGGNSSTGQENLNSNPTQDLIRKMDEVAPQVFGQNFGQVGGGGESLNIPETKSEGPQGVSMGRPESLPTGRGYNPGRSTALGGNAKLFMSRQSQPGGKPGPRGAGPAPGGQGGGLMGAIPPPPGGGPRGGGAGNRVSGGGGSRRRGGFSSGLSPLSDRMGRFTNIQGQGPSGGSPPQVKRRESAMDQMVREKIARNRGQNRVNLQRLNRDFRKNLNQGRPPGMTTPSFPNHEAGYQWLKQQWLNQSYRPDSKGP